jgi:hypothetical protein
VLRRCCAAGAFLAFTGAGPAHAQVNVEALRSQLKEATFGARVAGSLSSYAGNTQGVILGSAGLVGARLERHTGFLAVSGDYARLDQVVSVAKWFGHARHNYRLTEALWWEGRIDATLRYDSVGPADVNRADLALKNSLELAF